MNEIKYCERCRCVISVLEYADYYAHIRVKYCGPCAKIVEREQTAQRMRELRKRKKQQNKQRDIKLDLLIEENELQKQENELLRKSIIALRERLELLEKSYND